MSVLMIQAKVVADVVAEVEASARAMFAAIEETQPDGVRYASCVQPDGVTFVILLAIADGSDNPLPAIPAFVEFQRQLPGWLAEPSSAQPLTVVGSYNLF